MHRLISLLHSGQWNFGSRRFSRAPCLLSFATIQFLAQRGPRDHYAKLPLKFKAGDKVCPPDAVGTQLALLDLSPEPPH